MNRRKCESLYGSGWTFLLILFSTTVLLCRSGLLQAASASGDLNVDISVKSRPLKEVVNLVQEQTGYTIELKSIDESFPVTGTYSDTEAQEIFTHLLKGYNVSVEISHPDKLISVISLGGKIQLPNGSKTAETALPITADFKDQNSAIPPVVEVDAASSDKSASNVSLELTGLSNQNIQALHTQQAREVERKRHDPNAVDPLTGLSSVELEEMHKKQVIEFDKPSE